jgi:hypothetical protein
LKLSPFEINDKPNGRRKLCLKDKGVDVFEKKKIIEIPKTFKQRKSFFKEGNTMEIYITDLAAYNNGHLVGEWVSLPIGEDDLKAKIDEILSIGAEACEDDNHDEIFLTDFECDYLEIGEFDNPFKLNEIAEQADGLNDHELKMVSFLLRNGLVKDFTEALEKYEDVIIHENSTMEDVAYDFIDGFYNLKDLPPILANAIDYEKIGRELSYDGRYFEEDVDIYEYLG